MGAEVLPAFSVSVMGLNLIFYTLGSSFFGFPQFVSYSHPSNLGNPDFLASIYLERCQSFFFLFSYLLFCGEFGVGECQLSAIR